MAKTLVKDTDISLSSLQQQLLIKPAASNDSITAVQIQNSTGSVALNVDTIGPRVGIGTAAPVVRLQVGNYTAGTDEKITVAAGNSYTSTLSLYDYSTAWGFTIQNNGAYASQYLDFLRHQNSIPGVSAMVISRTSGNVGIGTTTPTAKLQVAGDALVNTMTVGLGAGSIGTNTAVGNNALVANTTGYYNTALGFGSSFANTTGPGNTALGAYTLYANTTGSNNVALGNTAGYYYNGTTGNNLTPSNSVYIGNGTSPLADAQTNQIVIGDSAIGAGSNTVTLGHTTIVTTILRGNVTATAGSLALKAPTTVNAATYSMTSNDSSLIITTTNCTITLLSAATYTGRILHIKNITATSLTSNASNVVPLGSATAGSAILAATAGKFAMLQSNGTNWITMMSN